MSIINGQPADASDFINESESDATPANDAGKVPKLEADGKLHNNFLNASGILGHTKTGTSLANSNTETTVYTKSLTADRLGANDGIRVTIGGSFATTNLADDPYVSVYFDTTEIGRFTIDTADLDGGGFVSASFMATLFIINNASVSSQNVFGRLTGIGNGMRADAIPSTISATVDTTKTFNTANAFDLTIRFKNENTDVTESWTFEYAVIEKLSFI